MSITGRHPWHYRHLRPLYPRKSDLVTRIRWIIAALIEGDGPHLRRPGDEQRDWTDRLRQILADAQRRNGGCQ
jgi:hypothetical protein